MKSTTTLTTITIYMMILAIVAYEMYFLVVALPFMLFYIIFNGG